VSGVERTLDQKVAAGRNGAGTGFGLAPTTISWSALGQAIVPWK